VAEGSRTIVSRVPDRAQLARAVRAALRQEVVRLSLSEAPGLTGIFTLEISTVSDRVRVSAEIMGPATDGTYPVRLRPLTRAQSAELFGLLETLAPTNHDSSPPAATTPTDVPAADGGDSAFDAYADTMWKSPSGPPPKVNPPKPTHEEEDEWDDAHAAADPSISLTLGDDFDDLEAALASLGSSPNPAPPAHTVSPQAELDESDQHPLVAIPDFPDLPPIELGPEGDLLPPLPEPEPPPFQAHSQPPHDDPQARDETLTPIAGMGLTVEGGGTVVLELPTEALAAPAEERESARISTPHPQPSQRISPAPQAPPATAIASLSSAGPAPKSAAAVPAPPVSPVPVAAVAVAPAAPPSRPPIDDYEFSHDEDAQTLIRMPIGDGKEPIDLGVNWDAPSPSLADLDIDIDEATITRKAPDGLAPPLDPLLGRQIAGGKYTIDSLVGSGATGAVYKAQHRDLRRVVAIKVLHPHYQNDLQFMKRFHGEALAASQLDHPNIMRVMDFGQEPDGLVYIVMEFLSGTSLQNVLKESGGTFTKDRAISVMMQVCSGLSAAHEQGIVHRDVKPDNIVIVPSRDDENRPIELVKVCDFGIAALQNTRSEDLDLSVGAGYICGTPEYMSPEQARGETADARTDVYACGCTIYELVTGRTPFMSENPLETIVHHAKDLPPPPSQFRKDIDPLLEEVILKSLAKDPTSRQQSARAMRTELKELLTDGEKPSFSAGETSGPQKAAAPPLTDSQSGFSAFFVAFASAICSLGPFQTEDPQQQAQNLKHVKRGLATFLSSRGEVTFARRDTQKSMGFFVLSGDGDAVDLKKLLGDLHGTYGQPFITELARRGVAALTIREGISDADLAALVATLRSHAEITARTFNDQPRESISALFAPDVIGRDRKLSWKVGLCISRLAKDVVLATKRGLSPRKLKETRTDLLLSAARVLAKPDELRQFLVNSDILNPQGARSETAAEVLVERLPLSRCIDVTPQIIAEWEQVPPGGPERERVKLVLSLLATRFLHERTPESFESLRELAKRKLVSEQELPPDLSLSIRAEGLADALARDPASHLRALEDLHDMRILQQSMAIFKAAMKLLAKRGEAPALLATVTALARIARSKGKSPGPREEMALKVMTSVVDKDRLLPTAKVMLVGQQQVREPARQLLILAGNAGAQALLAAREQLREPSGRQYFVHAMKQTGSHGAVVLGQLLSKLDPSREGFDSALAEDLLLAMPQHPDAALAEACGKFLKVPKLRGAALTALVNTAGDRARGLLIEALDQPDEAVRATALGELGRARLIDENVLGHIEKLLMARGVAGDSLRVAAAKSLSSCIGAQRARAVQILSRALEGKGGFLSMLRGAEQSEESPAVLIEMARALLVLDRGEGLRLVRARAQKAEGELRTQLTQLLEKPSAT
jgi:serine/threonine-protein kinase